MTTEESLALANLIQRLYGGPADGEVGDIVQLKRDVAEIRTAVVWVKAAAGIVGFLGLSGIVALFRGLGL